MNVMRKEVRDAAIGVFITDRPEELEAIHKPGCAAAIWRRQPLAVFRNWIEGLDPNALPTARLIIRPHAVPEAVSAICDTADMKKGPIRDMLVDDISALADTFGKVMNASHIRLRLDVVNDNACRKFHIDTLTARLVCTYRGAGTQYGISTDGMDPKRIFAVPTGAPIIIRGTKYPTGPKSGLLHRSPPIEGTGETRLVLVLDPVPSPDEAP
ncbi:MAG: DUF1826 domain-containing protein [Pseudomonadota bacterium]